MKALVTGGAGFIGGHLVSALLARGDHVTVLDNLSRNVRAQPSGTEHLRFVHGDIRDRACVADAAEGMDVIFHLAAQSSVLGAVTDLDYSFSTNVIGTYNVLCAARDAGVLRVIFTSSREVYGEPPTLPVREDAPLTPKNAYGASKVAGEMYCREFERMDGLEVGVLRLANVYGPGDRDRVVPLWLESARLGQDLRLYGGDQILDLVSIETVVAALCRAGSLSLDGLPVNVGSGRGVALRQLAAHIRSLAGPHVRVRVLPSRTPEVTRFTADICRMREVLGVEPCCDLIGDLQSLWGVTRSGAA